VASVDDVGSYLSVAEARDVTEPIRGINRLLELQQLDLSIDRLRTRLEALDVGDEVREARSRLGQAEARLGELRLALDAVAGEQRRLEGDVDSLERRIAAERTRLYDGSVANPKELQSIEAEVEGLAARKARVEDLVLEQMERREGLEARLGPLEVESEEARKQLEAVEEGSARELVEVEKALGEATARREGWVGEFDPDLLELYEDLRRQKKGVAAVALEDGICRGCQQKLSPMYLDGLKRDEGIRRCEYCRRILVYA
jgi:predicted  nucleic acid-binding Zn-ribbon protein